MRPVISACLVALLLAPATARDTRKEIENVAAFARLYGVVRYFYPSDAAASLDWDRFAIHGVRRVRAAADAKALQAILAGLFTPLGPGIEIGTRLPPAPPAGTKDAALVAWHYVGAGVTRASGPSVYQAKRTNRPLVVSSGIDGFVTYAQMLPATDLRGKTIRLRGRVRASTQDATGAAVLWLRVDRGQATGFFDNMSDRPIRDPAWKEYTIEGSVAEDATGVVLGVMASGGVTADFDVVSLSVRGPDGEWTSVPIRDPGFEAAASTAEGWTRAGTSQNALISRPRDGAAEGEQFLRLAAPPSTSITTELFEYVPANGAHADLDLASGLRARVPLSLTAKQASEDTEVSSPMAKLRETIASLASADERQVDLRLADIVVAWNVFQHFYPYWTEAAVDWNGRLRPQLELAYAADSRAAHLDALRQLVADVRDGHGNVADARGAGRQGVLPLHLRRVENEIVVTASGAADLPVGSVVSSIGGSPAAGLLSRAIQLASGTEQWKEVRGLRELVTCAPGTDVSVAFDSGAGSRTTTVRCETRQPPAEKRPAEITELSPGIWYVDLSRARIAQIRPALEQLAKATGVVFDLRGYPTDAGGRILPHLLDAPESDRWMHVNQIIGPFGQSAGWRSVGWNLAPAPPRVGGRIVFMTDGRAISYSESVLGYVADRKLATIVGGRTAGANGNVQRFAVPGGFTITFTGMRVTGHDGRTPHHLAGVKPDVPAAPTIAGIRAGRDEVLERAVAVIRGQSVARR